MQIWNSTPLQPALIAGRVPFPGHSLSLIVKGTFDLHPNGPATLAADQPTPTGDEFYPDDQDNRGAPSYESDFAYFKPRADLLLVGRCHAPAGRPALSCPVTFRVGHHTKTLSVSGDRRWMRQAGEWRPSSAAPFVEMDLRYENSSGSPDSPNNPIGKGGMTLPGASGEEYRPLPNIEDAHAPPLEYGRSSAPAGFGPIARGWEPRRSRLGTLDDLYVDTRWPWFAEDFDWTHFNAAPEGMQFDGYLRGDEELFFENLHSQHSQYPSRLPGLRTRCFVKRASANDPARSEFVEVASTLR